MATGVLHKERVPRYELLWTCGSDYANGFAAGNSVTMDYDSKNYTFLAITFSLGTSTTASVALFPCGVQKGNRYIPINVGGTAGYARIYIDGTSFSLNNCSVTGAVVNRIHGVS